MTNLSPSGRRIERRTKDHLRAARLFSQVTGPTESAPPRSDQAEKLFEPLEKAMLRESRNKLKTVNNDLNR